MIDARGYLCPMPVVMVQREVKGGNPPTIEVLVDDQCAVENITRFGKHSGYQVDVEERGIEFMLRLWR